jgi:hypothetical protein
MNTEKTRIFFCLVGNILGPTLISTSWFYVRQAIAYLQVLPRPSALACTEPIEVSASHLEARCLVNFGRFPQGGFEGSHCCDMSWNSGIWIPSSTSTSRARFL